MSAFQLSSNKHLTVPCLLLLLFAILPFFILMFYFRITFDESGLVVYRIYFAYLWICMVIASIYWMYHGVIHTTYEYLLTIVGLILNGIFFIFLTT